jgi:ribose-phosphate pyrophosphokinase
MVDDICDGGGTFLGLAEELKSKNAGKLFLAVSHGIFSKGISKLSSMFENIFTTDSIKSMDESEITQIDLNKILNLHI